MSSLSSLSSSSSSTWYSSSSGENDAFFENMIMYAAQIFMAEDENSEALSQRQTRRTKLNRDKECTLIFCLAHVYLNLILNFIMHLIYFSF
ncbi:hypothetical protein HanRHA438_Chr05g0237911 [Helianthus annuus]|nr:hypothetical protein HanRHA438_Chr05g0237911 [Helianthus annuus]